MIRAVIIDDERLARARVEELLQSHTDQLEIVGQADTGSSAIQLINETKPELIFLDIHLPDMSGFEILEKLSYEPMIIFTTAYEKYAVDAFTKYAIDYLVKPITKSRFNQAIEKLSKFNWSNSSQDIDRLVSLLKNQPTKKASSIAIKKGEKIILVDYEDIAYFKSEDKYVNVCLADGTKHLTDKTLTQLVDLVPDNIIRVHRSYLVNRDYISEIEKYFKGTLILTMSDKHSSSIKTGEKYSRAVKKSLGL
jgi:two-component system LytT family response regulator